MICPQCGKEDAYFQPEPEDYTSANISIFQIPWRCRYCGYPEVYWNKFIEPIFQKITINIKITDPDGNIIKREYYD